MLTKVNIEFCFVSTFLFSSEKSKESNKNLEKFWVKSITWCFKVSNKIIWTFRSKRVHRSVAWIGMMLHALLWLKLVIETPELRKCLSKNASNIKKNVKKRKKIGTRKHFTPELNHLLLQKTAAYVSSEFESLLAMEGRISRIHHN